MRTLTILLLALVASVGSAAEGAPDQAQRDALRQQMEAIHTQNRQTMEAARDQCRARIRAALAGHPEMLARAEQRFQQMDARMDERREQRQDQRQGQRQGERQGERQGKRQQRQGANP